MDIRTGSLSVATADGPLPCHLARPVAGGPYPGVIVVMEAFGLNGHIKAVAERLAREGYVTVAPDLYHRFGSPIVPYADVPKAIELLKRLNDAKVMGDLGAVIAHLTSRPEIRRDRIGITGFCMGGRIAFMAAAHHARAIKAAVSFYGGGIGANVPGAPIEAAPRIEGAVLLLWGERDQMIPLDQVSRVEATMRRLDKTCESRVYEGAGHGFFCDERPSYHPESAADAWSRLTEWFSKYLK